ncbi:MAG: hypothetical protein ACRDJL_12115, partial [Actinomycetota bacterium]
SVKSNSKLSKGGRPVTARRRQSPISPRRARILERIVHLVTGVVLVAYVYATPPPQSALTSGVRWLLPLVVFSGVAMWQGPRVRRFMRRARA